MIKPSRILLVTQGLEPSYQSDGSFCFFPHCSLQLKAQRRAISDLLCRLCQHGICSPRELNHLMNQSVTDISVSNNTLKINPPSLTLSRRSLCPVSVGGQLRSIMNPWEGSLVISWNLSAQSMSVDEIIQGSSQLTFSLQDRKSCNLSGQPVPVFEHDYNVGFFSFLSSQSLPFFSLCPLPLALPLCTLVRISTCVSFIRWL